MPQEIILFSPLGTISDPIRDHHDGAFLHILRHYRPSKAYLLMTKAVCRFDDLDDRYVRLGRRVQPECHFIKERYEEIDDAYGFNFEKLMSDTLQRIIQDHPDAKILVNLSSGTSAMKSAVYLACASAPQRVEAIRVRRIAERSYPSLESMFRFDVEMEWQTNLDNDADMPNRGYRVDCGSVRAMILVQIIETLLDSNEYRGALEAISSLPAYFSERSLHLIRAGMLRCVFRADAAAQEAAELDPPFQLLPVRERQAQDSFEYLLIQEIRLKRGDLASFVRGTTPVIMDLFIDVLRERYQVDILQFCKLDKNSIYLVNPKNFPQEFLDFCIENGSPLRMTTLSSVVPLWYLQYLAGEEDVCYQTCARLRQFEASVRNLAAHEMVSITNRVIKHRTGQTADEHLEDLKWLLIYIYPQHAEHFQWDSYQLLNQEIMRQLYLDLERDSIGWVDDR